MVCTEPLPNERVPRRVARWWSCSAPATISEAEAEPPLISTMSGLPSVRSPGGMRIVALVSSGLRPRVETISPLSRKAFDTDRLIEQAAGIVAQIDDEALELVGPSCVLRSLMAFCSPAVVCSLNCVMRM